MKILVFSDSHRYVRSMYAAMEDGKPDLVLHLGDMLRDAEELSYAYPQQSIVMVPGNCDGWTTQPLQKLLDIQGKKLLLSHGHIWQVKSGYERRVFSRRGYGAVRPHPPGVLRPGAGRAVGAESGRRP